MWQHIITEMHLKQFSIRQYH